MRVCLVAGTHGNRGENRASEWWWPTSPFAQFLTAQGHEVVGAARPFVWTTDVGGLGGHHDWRAGGENLYAYLVPPLCPDRRIKPDDCAVIAHSHGLQVALYAAAAGLIIDVLVSVCAPVREDMAQVAERARPNVRRWLHLYSDDLWQVAGGFFDGHLGIRRAQPLANRNEFVDNVGHTGLLERAAFFPMWIDRGWLLYCEER